MVALYPALASSGQGSCACAWYEYSSADRPARSDIWLAGCSGEQAGWGSAANISGGRSYNNGPSLIAIGEDQFLAAWHSWRPPGRDPFLADGDICNVWQSRREQGQWSDPGMVFPELRQTEYASLAASAGRFQLACYHRETGRILFAESGDGRCWQPLPEFPAAFGKARFPSLGALPDGSLVLAFNMAGDEGLWFSRKNTAGVWSEPKRICELPGEKLAKPKLSVDSSGAVWVAAQTEHWGSSEELFRIEVGDGEVVELDLRSRGGAGNAMWTLNEIDFRDLSGVSKKCLRFGPEPGPLSPQVTYVSARDWAYSAARGCGFDLPVEELLRELGSDVTRRLVFCPEPRRLRVDLSPGSYEMRVTYSSWIASCPALELRSSVPCAKVRAPDRLRDRCYFFREHPEGDFRLTATTPAEQEHNRPGAVCETRPGCFQLAWTSFAGETVQIVTQNISIP